MKQNRVSFKIRLSPRLGPPSPPDSASSVEQAAQLSPTLYKKRIDTQHTNPHPRPHHSQSPPNTPLPRTAIHLPGPATPSRQFQTTPSPPTEGTLPRWKGPPQILSYCSKTTPSVHPTDH